MNIPNVRIENFCIAAKDEGTVVMKAVWLDVEGERLMATNGHKVARVSIGVVPEDVSGIIPVEAFELARKELKAIIRINGKDDLPDPWLSVVCNEETVVIQNLLTNTTHFVTRPKLSAEEKKFPNVDAIFETLTTQPTVSLAGAYLADIVKSLDGDGLSFWVEGPEKAVIMASSMGQAVIGLMPRKEHVDPAEVSKRGLGKEAPLLNPDEKLSDSLGTECELSINGKKIETLGELSEELRKPTEETEKSEDELYKDAVTLVTESGKASTSLLQSRLRIGYGRAAHLIDLMEQAGLVGPADGPKARAILTAGA